MQFLFENYIFTNVECCPNCNGSVTLQGSEMSSKFIKRECRSQLILWLGLEFKLILIKN